MNENMISLFGGEALLQREYPKLYQALSLPLQPEHEAKAVEDVVTAKLAVDVLSCGRETVQVRVDNHFADRKAAVLSRVDFWNNDTETLLDTCFVYEENAISQRAVYGTSPLEETMGIRTELHSIWINADGSCGIGEKKTYAVSDPHVDARQAVRFITVKKPRAKNHLMTMVGYLGRHSETMDYEYDVKPSGGTIAVMLPFQGEVTFLDDWRAIEILQKESIFGPAPELLLKLVNGGTVPYGGDLGAALNIVDGQVIWDFHGQEDWKSSIDISHFSAETIVRLQSKFTVKIQNQKDPNYFMYLVVYIDSKTPKDQEEIQRLGVTVTSELQCEIEPIRLLWGCFGENTRIRMADGSERTVQEIRMGDRVCTAQDGIAEVQDIITGNEENIVFLRADSGEEICLTESHPILTRRGMVRAENLNAADQLVMEDGRTEKISELYLRPYGRRVYNLWIEPTENLCCNGFICGDFGAENQIGAKTACQSIYSSEGMELQRECNRLYQALKEGALESGER